jgi:hypothetical protein
VAAVVRARRDLVGSSVPRPDEELDAQRAHVVDPPATAQAMRTASAATRRGTRAGTMLTSRMPLVWWFSATGKARTSPSAARASTTETSRPAAPAASSTQGSPPKDSRKARAASASIGDAELALAVVAEARALRMPGNSGRDRVEVGGSPR